MHTEQTFLPSDFAKKAFSELDVRRALLPKIAKQSTPQINLEQYRVDAADWMEHGYSKHSEKVYQAQQAAMCAKSDAETLSRRLSASKRAFSAHAGRMERSVLVGAANGLVTVSTTCKGSFPIYSESDSRSLESIDREQTLLENSITIDTAQARVTRLRKGIGVGAKCLHNAGGKGQRMWLVTLTYRGTNAAWRPEQISRYLDNLRKWHYKKTGSKKVRYAWVAEIQDGKSRADGIGRGVIHYHVVIWLAPGLCVPRPDKSGMWPHGMSNRKEATAPIAYLMKYVSKTDSKNIGAFPHGARIYGLGGLDKSGRDCKRWVLWPAYVQGNAAVGDTWKRNEGGGFINVETGEILESEYAPSGRGFTRFVRVRTHPRQVDACGPFSWYRTPANTLH